MALSAMRSGRVSARGAQARIRSVAVRPSVQRPSSRSPTVSVKAFFSFLQPKAPASSAKAAELAEELIELVSSKRASAADVNKLVSELQPFGIKNPVRSKQLFGTYKLVYTSKAGGSTNVTQVLEEPDQVREVTEVKVLGLLSGTQTTSGELNGVSGDTYEELYDKVEVKAPVGGESRSVDKARLVQVLYLDQELRVVRVKEEGEAGDGAMLVYQRVAEDGEEDEEEQGGKQQGGAAALFGFGASGAKEGTATIAEREVLRKMAAAKDAKGAAKPAPRLPANLPSSPAAAAAARGGTVKVGPPAARANSPAPPAARGGTVKVEAKPSADAQRREAEAKAKAKEASLAKEKAEADKRAAAERQASIKAQLEQLSEQLREAQAEARDAAKEAKDLERANGAVLKQVAGARLQIRSATDEVEKVEEQLAQATQARAAAEQALKQALAGVSEAKARSSRK